MTHATPKVKVRFKLNQPPSPFDSVIDDAVATYVTQLSRYKQVLDLVTAKCHKLIADRRIRASIQGRVKDPQSFREKLYRWSSDGSAAKRRRLRSESSIFKYANDLVGVRIATYLESDRASVVDAIQEVFAGPRNGRPDVEKKDSQSRARDYRATHCGVTILEQNLSCEIQVCSLLAHVWNEIEHDLKYKPRSGELSEPELRMLEQLGQLTRSGDIAIQLLLEATDRRVEESERNFRDMSEFVQFSEKQFPSLANFTNNCRQLYDMIVAFGLDTPGALQHVVLGKNCEARSEARLNALVRDMSRRGDRMAPVLDFQSSDRMMILLFERFAGMIAQASTLRGGRRWRRASAFARRYLELYSEGRAARQDR